MYTVIEQRKGGPKMLKKFASLLLSLLMCLSLLPGQACAGVLPEPPEFPVVVEPVELEGPGEPVMPMSEELPGGVDTDHKT